LVYPRAEALGSANRDIAGLKPSASTEQAYETSSTVWLLGLGCDHNDQEHDSNGHQNDTNHHKDPVLVLRRWHEYVDSSGLLSFGPLYFGLLYFEFLYDGLLYFGFLCFGNLYYGTLYYL